MRFNGRYLLMLLLLSAGCEDKPKTVVADDQSAKEFAQIHCSSCHAFVEAESLPRSGWQDVLPIMGYFMGKAEEGYVLEDENIPGVRERLESSYLFAHRDKVSDEDWMQIQEYYNSNSPESLEEYEQELSSGVGQFAYEVIPWKGPSLGVTLIRYQNNHFTVGSSVSQERSELLYLSTQGVVDASYEAQTPVVDIIPVLDTSQRENMDMVLQIGRMENFDDPSGQIAMRTDQLKTVVGPLQRPVDLVMQDFDNDGGADILIAEFGKYQGGINIYHQSETLTRKAVFSMPGATKFELRDVNQDGLMDFYCLVAQADESIYLFTNKGDFTFESKRLLQLPPYYGLVNFELIDFDGDGDEDIICSNGDSGDYTPYYKPYHGVRIFENQGDEQYEEKWFFSQQGSFGTVSHDFDGDGDIDFGSIGHLASMFGMDETGFIYFENTSTPDKPWSFQAHALTGVPDNCWVLIESADVDDDGDMDIILGANTTFVSKEIADRNLQKWAKEGGIISILRNNLH